MIFGINIVRAQFSVCNNYPVSGVSVSFYNHEGAVWASVTDDAIHSYCRNESDIGIHACPWYRDA